MIISLIWSFGHTHLYTVCRLDGGVFRQFLTVGSVQFHFELVEEQPLGRLFVAQVVVGLLGQLTKWMEVA